MTRILVTGSRDWHDEIAIEELLFEYSPGLLVHGACPTGADAIADAIATRWNWDIERHPADWDRHGKKAGPLRNQHMVDLGADVCLAFILNGSRGASHTARIAEAAGIPTVRVERSER